MINNTIGKMSFSPSLTIVISESFDLKTVSKRYNGRFVDSLALQSLLRYFGYTDQTWIPIPVTPMEEFSELIRNGTWDLMGNLFVMDYERTQYFDFVYPFDVSENVIISTPKIQEPPSVTFLLQPFGANVWLVASLTYLLLQILTNALQLNRSRLCFTSIVLLVFRCAITLLLVLYSANLKAVSFPFESSPIRGPHELSARLATNDYRFLINGVGKRVTQIYTSAAEDIVELKRVLEAHKPLVVPSLEDTCKQVSDAVNSQTKLASIDQLHSIRLYCSDYSLSLAPVSSLSAAILSFIISASRKRLRKQLDMVSMNGVLLAEMERYKPLRSQFFVQQKTSTDMETMELNISLRHLGLAFSLLFVGWLVSFLVFLAETMTKNQCWPKSWHIRSTRNFHLLRPKRKQQSVEVPMMNSCQQTDHSCVETMTEASYPSRPQL